MNKVVEPAATATLKEVQHTPGPWAVGPYRGGSRPGKLRGTLIVSKALPSGSEPRVGIALDEGAVLQLGVVLASPHPGINAETSKANARLIAAAPDLLSEHTEACDAADHILALMTMEFGRLMVEGPDEEIELTMCGCSVRIPAHYFNRLYNATTRKSISKATSSSSPKGGSTND